jgi:hypothetical protein
MNLFHKIDEKYSVFELKSCDSHYKSLIDTRYVNILQKFKWKVPQSKDPNRRGVYFMASINTKQKNEFQSILKNDHLVFMHELIALLSCSEKPSTDELLTIDHINRETLDNRSENLRWATILQQNRNRNKKRNRKLPPDYIPNPLPMYVTWNSGLENTSQGKTILREFFRIEKHPALPRNQNNETKIWSSSKHSEVTIYDKYQQTLKKLEELNTIEAPDTSMDKIRIANLQSYSKIMNIPLKKHITQPPPEQTELKRDNLILHVVYKDFLLIEHTDGSKAITNAKFFKDLKNFSIYTENGLFLASVTNNNQSNYKLECCKSSLARVILHLEGEFCKNDNKKLRYTCHKNGIQQDCRIENLYWGSKTQQQMCKEKKLITNLPDNCGVDPLDVPKYVYYHPEPKEYWFITHHPALEDLGKSTVFSSTSKNVSTLDKFKEICNKLQELNSQCSNICTEVPDFVTESLQSSPCS